MQHQRHGRTWLDRHLRRSALVLEDRKSSYIPPRLLDCTGPRLRLADASVLAARGSSVTYVERFTEGTELTGAAEVQLQIDLIR